VAFYYPTNEPPSFGRQVELVPIALKALQLSNVGPGHRLVIYSDTQRTKSQLDAFFTAAQIVGAETVVVLTVPRNDPDRNPLPQACEAMKRAETVIDLSTISWIYTTPFSEVLEKGVRILSSMANPDTWVKMPPDERISAVSKRSSEIIEAATTLRFTTPSGTALDFDKGRRMGTWQDGLLDEPGDWDNFPSAQAACAPLEDHTTGRLVIEPGDILVSLKHIVGSRITCDIRAGCIEEISGGADAALLRQFLAKTGDPNAYRVSHIGWGLEPRAEIAAMQMMEWESYGGGIMIAFGANDGRFLGGTTHCRSHMDIVILNGTFECDGTTVVDGGHMALPELQLPTFGPSAA
jgi:2,5-dihydroxypyridine 5,6-dioxygenase